MHIPTNLPYTAIAAAPTEGVIGYTGAVYSVAITPDGHLAISGLRDGTLKLWDLETGEELHILKGHTGVVTSVSLIPGGHHAISGSYDNTLKVWDLETREAIQTLMGHTDYVLSVSVTPDGYRVVSGSEDNTLRIWDLESGREIRTPMEHNGAVMSVSVTPDIQRIVSGSYDNTLKVWDLEKGEEIHTLKGHINGVASVSVTPNGRLAVSGSYDRTLKVWDLEKGEEIHTLKGHTNSIASVSVILDGHRAVSGSYDRTLKVWDLEKGEEIHTLKGHADAVMSVSVTQDGRRAISGSWDGTLKVWDLETGAEIRTLGRGIPNFWIFQALPDRYDLEKELAPGKGTNWTVSRFGDEIKYGDVVYFWQAGRQCFYGWGTVTSEEPFETGGETRAEVSYEVRFESPIQKSQLEQDSQLREMHLFKVKTGTNFRVRPEEAMALNRVIQEQGFQAPPDPVLPPKYALKTPLSPGDKGLEVELVQSRLKELGRYSGEMDGRFGPEMQSAVASFQEENKLAADGIVGPETWERLFQQEIEVGLTDTEQVEQKVSPTDEAQSAPVTPPPVIYVTPVPPEREHAISIDVKADEVLIRYGNKQYKSPSKLDHDKLEKAENISPKDYGELLFKGIIHSEASDGFVKRPTMAGYSVAFEQARGELRVQLVIDQDMPFYKWEYIRDPNDKIPLSVYERSPLYRLYGSVNKGMVAARPLKVLFAICSPTNLGKEGPVLSLTKLDADLERDIIERGMQRLKEEKLAEYEILYGSDNTAVTLDAIKEKLQENFHVLHILAHGHFLQRRKDYHLVLEREDRKHDFVSADQFDAAMLGYDLRLVVLAACQSAVPETGNALVALGPQLVENGVPAVIAMQDKVPVEAVQIFTQRFYEDLARSGRVDMAMASARHDIYTADPRSWAWGIPMLLLGTDRDKLFDVDEERAKLFDVDEESAKRVPRPKLEELDRKSYNELRGHGNPAPWKAAQDLENQVRLQVYGGDPALISAPQVIASRPPEGEPLAPEQDREALEELSKHSVNIIADELKQYSKLELPQKTYAQIASVLNVGKHIILIGPPGTGKTSLAHAICTYAAEKGFSGKPTLTTATADWTTFDTVGGYVPTPQQTLQFRLGVFLKAISTGSWLVIDEINRAEIDKAFGELFTVLSGQQVDLPYTIKGSRVRVFPPEKAGEAAGGYDYVMHPNWRIVGTMNVYDRSFLFAMSFAFMRRFAFVEVGVPPRGDFSGLVDKWLSDQMKPLRDMFNSMLNTNEELMKHRALGPAIVKDMIEYIENRYGDGDGEESLREYMAEAFLLYVVPQLDGLSHDSIGGIHNQIRELFKDAGGQNRDTILKRILMLYPHIKIQD